MPLKNRFEATHCHIIAKIDVEGIRAGAFLPVDTHIPAGDDSHLDPKHDPSKILRPIQSNPGRQLTTCIAIDSRNNHAFQMVTRKKV